MYIYHHKDSKKEISILILKNNTNFQFIFLRYGFERMVEVKWNKEYYNKHTKHQLFSKNKCNKSLFNSLIKRHLHLL